MSSPPIVLVPPRPQTRHRASSTGCRPKLSIVSLERRQQLSTLESSPIVASPIAVQLPPRENPSPSMFVLIASRLLDWFHVPTKHSRAWSSSTLSSSPRSSTDESILPISASVQTTFNDVFDEKDVPAGWQFLPTVHAPIILVILLFPLSTVLVLSTLYTLPLSLSSWPRTLTDLAQLGRELHGYSRSGWWSMAHVMGVMSVTAIWKHAWSIPGSVVWNVLGGALFYPAPATLFLTSLTTLGSLCASLLSIPLGPYLTYFFPRALDLTRAAIQGPDMDANPVHKPASSTWVRLSVLRLVGIVPWSGINIACGLCGVRTSDIMLGAFIGTMPWTAVTCEIGDILHTIASSPSPSHATISSLLTSPSVLCKLAFLSVLSLAPLLAREHLRAWITPPSGAADAEEERRERWTWVKEWRGKIRLSSRSRTRKRQMLEVLVREKEQMYEAQDVRRLS